MLTVKDILLTKGDYIWSIGPETTTIDALRFMAGKDVGALLILEEGLIVGIISERDFVHRIANDKTCKLDQPVSEYMTAEVITVKPEQTIQECMQIMTANRIRHLPVLSGDHLFGLISIGDVVKAFMFEQNAKIDSLENYIIGGGRV